MGNVCICRDEPIHPDLGTVITFKDEKSSCIFKLSTKTVSQSSGECLLLFVDPFGKITSNSFLDKKLALKIKQYIDVKMKNRSLKAGQYIILQNIQCKKLKFKNVAIFCVSVWSSQESKKQQFLSLGNKLIQFITKDLKKFKNLVYTDYNSQFGIPLDMAELINKKIIRECSNKFESVEIICTDDNSQKQKLNFVQKWAIQKKMSLGSSGDSNSSDYF